MGTTHNLRSLDEEAEPWNLAEMYHHLSDGGF